MGGEDDGGGEDQEDDQEVDIEEDKGRDCEGDFSAVYCWPAVNSCPSQESLKKVILYISMFECNYLSWIVIIIILVV